MSEGATTFRTVVLKKSQVEVNGENRQIIMVRDISLKVRLKQEHIKKKKEQIRTSNSQKKLKQVLSDHQKQIGALYSILRQD